MNCKTVQDLISLYINQELDNSITLSVKTHIESCKDCQKLLREYKKMLSDLAQLKIIEIPETTQQKMWQKIKAKITMREKERPLVFTALAYAAILIAGIVFGLLLYSLFWIPAPPQPTDTSHVVEKTPPPTPPEITKTTPTKQPKPSRTLPVDMRRIFPVKDHYLPLVEEIIIEDEEEF